MKSRLSSFWRVWLILFVLLLVLGVLELAFILIHSRRISPKRAQVCPAEFAVIVVNPGEGLKQVAYKLKEKNIIQDENLFIFLARLKGADTKIRPGEYEFILGTPMSEVLKSLVLGRQKYYQLKVVPGSNFWEIAKLIDLNRIWSGEHFLSLAHNPVFIRSLGIPADSLEGYLHPDTYQFHRFDSEEFIIRTMVKHSEESWKPEYEEQAKKMGFTKHQILTIASIIEKETGLKEEKPLVSAVIHNRLKKKMGLFMDPTVIYGLLPNFDGNLTKKDLEKWTPYNTYKNLGLPPGPICNPSESSIRAALWPAPVNYLYFVSKGDGSHYFSSRYADHLKAVAEYQGAKRLLEEPNLEPIPEEQFGQTISPEQ